MELEIENMIREQEGKKKLQENEELVEVQPKIVIFGFF